MSNSIQSFAQSSVGAAVSCGCQIYSDWGLSKGRDSYSEIYIDASSVENICSLKFFRNQI
jgi:hypothetical protein